MKNNVFITLLPVTLAVFIAFLTMGMQLPVLPLHLQQNLGMDTLAIGTVIGAQFIASLLTRSWAGNFADMRGAKRAVLTGLLVVASSGVIYLISLLFVDRPASSVAILLLGRVVLALGESLLATGALGWGLGLVGPANAGKVMAWIGIAIYGAWALGAPLGVAIYHGWHFTGIAMAIIVVPLLPLMFITQVRAVAPTSTKRTPFYKVMGAVWRPGLGLALASVGFGMITAFIALLFAARAWGNASLAFTAFGVAFIAARLFFAHLPDKLGGARVALVCVLIEACGQLLIWGADDATLVYFGAALTGFGYSLAFPAFGVEAVRRAPPHTRSLAMGAYVAFLDIALAITSPLAGALAAHRGVASVYLAGAIAVALAMLVALSLMARQPQPQAAME
ncbi:arabinose transporter [Pantoea sp. ICBG 828]|uniref:arabinose transporter n=1 Tax=unclassified Pantoea TaxID=2630326 RepID=UPI000CE2FA8F|nr:MULTISPECIES: arabinose transporter [unclassified Pantoea]NIG34870.1 MFS transporter [Pantoea sp. Ap-959]PPC67438.1 arabinose transporter [Pantoea sp. ICBG 828]